MRCGTRHDSENDRRGRRHVDHWDVTDKKGKNKKRLHPKTLDDLGDAVDEERNKKENKEDILERDNSVPWFCPVLDWLPDIDYDKWGRRSSGVAVGAAGAAGAIVVAPAVGIGAGIGIGVGLLSPAGS